MTTTAQDTLLAWRPEFPVVTTTAYLLSHSMGAMPRRATGWMARYAQEWSENGAAAWEKWDPYLLAHGNLIGALVGAPRDSIIMHQNVSTLVSIALSALFRPGGRTKIVTTALNFPSVVYNFKMHERLGLRVQLLESPDGVTIPLEAWEAAVDEHTLAVAVDHGIFRSGFVQDARAIAAIAHAKGAHALVDAYQTTGCVPFNVTDWDADIVVGGSHKWLCGGPGAAWMYVKPALIPGLEPRVTGWFSHARPFAFDLDMEFAPGVMRFATGTPNIAGLYAARAGLDIVTEIGIEAIRRKSLRLTEKIIALADEHGLRVNTPREADRRGGVMCIDFEGAQQAERELVRRGVLVDYRPRCGLRLSPHFYTADDDIIRVFEEIRAIRR